MHACLQKAVIPRKENLLYKGLPAKITRYMVSSEIMIHWSVVVVGTTTLYATINYAIEEVALTCVCCIYKLEEACTGGGQTFVQCWRIMGII